MIHPLHNRLADQPGGAAAMEECLGQRRQPAARCLPFASAGRMNTSARRAVYTLFLVDGAGFGLWAGHIPAFRERFGLNELHLSALLFCLVLGSLVAMPLTGQAIARYGSRRLRGFLPGDGRWPLRR